MGHGFSGKPLVYQEDFHPHHAQRFHLFRAIIESTPHEGRFSYNILLDLINNDERWA